MEDIKINGGQTHKHTRTHTSLKYDTHTHTWTQHLKESLGRNVHAATGKLLTLSHITEISFCVHPQAASRENAQHKSSQ